MQLGFCVQSSGCTAMVPISFDKALVVSLHALIGLHADHSFARGCILRLLRVEGT